MYRGLSRARRCCWAVWKFWLGGAWETTRRKTLRKKTILGISKADKTTLKNKRIRRKKKERPSGRYIKSKFLTVFFNNVHPKEWKQRQEKKNSWELNRAFWQRDWTFISARGQKRTTIRSAGKDFLASFTARRLLCRTWTYWTCLWTSL